MESAPIMEFMDLDALLDKYYLEDYDSDDYDHSKYCDGYDDYNGVDFGDYVDTEEDERNEMTPVWTVLNDDIVSGDEKKQSDMSGTKMDSQLILHHHTGDEEKTNMDIEDRASEDIMATERKKKEKRKTQEDGVESEQNEVYSDGYCDYLGVSFSDDEEGEQNDMSFMGTVSVDATIMSGTSMDSQLMLHHHSGVEEITNMDIKDGASEGNMATEMRKKEKHKSQEHGVESEQNDDIETAIEVKKKKDSMSNSNV